MARFQVVPARLVLTALGLSLGLSAPLLAQRTDRAVISGVVTDAVSRLGENIQVRRFARFQLGESA